MKSRWREVPACFTRTLPQAGPPREKWSRHMKSRCARCLRASQGLSRKRILLVKCIISRELCVENKNALWYTLVVFVNNLKKELYESEAV